MFDPGLDITPTHGPLGFVYGSDVRGPTPEVRTLDAIRPSLRDPHAEGPEQVYAIAMDVRHGDDEADLKQRHLLFGVVTYAAGQLGNEPIRSQGHVHVPNPRDGWRTPEVYEIWQGRAVILMQEHCAVESSATGRCVAVEADPGDVVIVPPGWAHATISADPAQPLTFGAWCDRAYGFEYEAVRAHGGLAYFPLVDARGELTWEPNPNYDAEDLRIKPPGDYDDLGLAADQPIYTQYRQDRARFDFVPDPGAWRDVWDRLTP